LSTQQTALHGWALILGASSGFGEATALTLARRGVNVFGVHMDRRATLGNVERIVGEIQGMGREAVFFNVNAADAEKRQDVLDQMARTLAERGEPGAVIVLLHSLAFGALRPYIAEDPKDTLSQSQLEMTLDVMANSLVYWTQDLLRRKLMGPGGRIFATCGPPMVPFPPPRPPWKPTSASSRTSWRRTRSRRIPSGPASPIRLPCARFPATTE
jgi:enoyl-[acyl-carrier protein] reductase III